MPTIIVSKYIKINYNYDSRVIYSLLQKIANKFYTHKMVHTPRENSLTKRRCKLKH